MTEAGASRAGLLLRIFRQCQHRLVQVRRKFPYLVWYGDELDVRVTFTEDRLSVAQSFPDAESSLSLAQRHLNRGAFAKMENAFSELGIQFDKGVGFDGRDWEWDWSLEGPIKVRFRSRAKRPERRVP